MTTHSSPIRSQTTISLETITQVCRSLLSDDRVTIDCTVSLQIDGREHPIVVVEPETEQEASRILAFANENKLHVCVSGSGTQLNYGNVPEPIDLLVRTGRMNRILEYSPADMTITVQSGVRLHELKSYLAQHGQMLAIDPPCSADATVGGIVATDVCGPMRTLYGTLRDQVIGMRVIYPSGACIQAGGKVVKNVAGYDMTKLFIGSLGTLALLSEITCKLKPLPLHRELCFIGGNIQQIEALSAKIIDSNLIPSALEVLSASFVNSESLSEVAEKKEIQKEANLQPWMLAVGCDEVASAAAKQTKILRGWANDFGLTFEVRQGKDVEAFWEEYRTTACAAPFKMKLISKATTIMKDVEAICEAAKEWQLPVKITVNRAQGTAELLCTEGTFTQWEELIHEARTTAERCNGFACMLDAPLELRRKIDAFGQTPATFPLMKGIKHAIDPIGILNSGRFLGGM